MKQFCGKNNILYCYVNFNQNRYIYNFIRRILLNGKMTLIKNQLS
jgi:hypothetical protein